MNNPQQRKLPSKEMIDEYEIEKTLGSGGFGITYLATDTRLQRQVAIKEYFPQNAWRDNTTKAVHAYDGEATNSYQIGLDRFFKEGQILAQFKHYNIVSVQRLISANNTAYLVMDYVHGETLEKYLQRLGRPLTYEEVEQIFNPLLDGLKAVHEHNLLHLDIKPENIFLRKDGMPVLIDFGGARFQLGKSSQAVSFLVATEGYAPNEQYTAGELSPATDIYAVAATLYRALTGNVPIDSQSRSLSMIDHAKDSLLPLESNLNNQTYPLHFIQTINQAISLRMSERPQTVKEFQLALFSNSEQAKKPANSSQPLAEDLSTPSSIQIDTQNHPNTNSGKRDIWKPIMAVIGTAIAGLLGILAWNSNSQPRVITVSTHNTPNPTLEETNETKDTDANITDHQQPYTNEEQPSPVIEKLPETNQSPPPEKVYFSALVFDPPSNVRDAPKGTISCVIDTRQTIHVIPLSNNPDWYKTDSCGSDYNDFIHHTQINVQPKPISQNTTPSQYDVLKQSSKTKIYKGKWKGVSAKVYIKWDDYSGSGGKISGIVESSTGTHITSFGGSNYAFRKLKLSLNNGENIYVKATISGSIKTWSSPDITFSRKYK